MFYSTEILSKRPDGLGIYWLAAILGAGSKGGVSFKKLNKKQIVECDLVKACEKLVSPTEPFALRFFSNLLCGIARVYQKQYTIYQSEVDRFHHSVHRAFSDVYQKSKAEQQLAVDLPLPQHPQGHAPAGINLAIDADLALIGWNVDWEIGLDWMDVVPGNSEAGDEEGEVDFGSGVLFEDDAPELARHRAQSSLHQARDLASISLVEPQLDAYGYGYGGREEEDMGGMGPLDFGDEYGFEVGDAGILAGHSPDLDAAIQAGASRQSGSNASRKWAGGSVNMGAFSSSVGAGYNPLGDWQEDPMAGADFGGGDDYMVDQNVESMNDRVRREHDEGVAQRDFGFGANRRESSAQHDDAMVDGSASTDTRKRALADMDGRSDDENDADVVKKVKRRKLAKKVAYDPVIRIEDEKFMASRALYNERIEGAQAVSDLDKFEKREKARAIELVSNVPDIYGAEELVHLWKDSVDIAPFERKRGVKKQVLNAQDPNADPGMGRHINTDDAYPGYNGEEGGPNDIDMGGMGDYDFPDFGGGGEGFPPAFNEGGDELGLYDDVEQGRAGSRVLASQRSSLLPWNQHLATSDVAFDFPGLGFASSLGGTNAKVSLGTPFKFRGSRTGSLQPSAMGSLSPGQGKGFDDLLNDEFIGFEGVGDQVEQQATFNEAEIAMATLEKESFNFLTFAKRQVLGDDGSLLFSDIVPEDATNASVAAQALYHVLALATKGLIHVKQDQAFGDINIEILA